MIRHWRCLGYALAGVLLGWAVTAQGQDPGPVVAVAADPYSQLVALVSAGGTPAALGFLGWLFGRGGVPVQVTVAPSVTVEALMTRGVVALERLVDRLADREDTASRRPR